MRFSVKYIHMWDVLDIVSWILIGLSDTSSGPDPDFDGLSLFNTKSRPERETPPPRSMPPFILTLDLNKKS